VVELDGKQASYLKNSYLTSSISDFMKYIPSHNEPVPGHSSTCDVVVVGAGPAGLGAAIACAKAGLD